MTHTPEHIDDLIAGYFAGEATPEQVEMVDRWRSQSEENEKYFHQLRLIFEKAASFRETLPFDTDEAWNRVREKLSESRTIPITQKDAGFSWLKIAAGIILLITAGLFAYRFVFTPNPYESRQLASGQQTSSDTLPDGSQVFLNRETRIEYKFEKASATHIAKLSGEAYFDVHHAGEQDFVVEAGGTLIKDIGTSFNVRAYPGSNIVEVVVEEGEVLFYTEQNPGIHLKANDRGTYDKVSGQFSVQEAEPNITAYKTRSFTFSNHSLDAVVERLNDVYDRKVHISDNLKACRLTVSFREESIEEIVQVMAETLSLSVDMESDTIRLSGAGCGEASGE